VAEAAPAVRLAKDRIDVGFYTSRYVEAEVFWRDVVGLEYEELLKVGGGVHQHRYGLRGSVCKVNAARAELAAAPSAFRRLVVAREGQAEPELLHEPDGTEVAVVPPGHDGVADLGVVWATPDAAGLGRLLVDGWGAADEGDGRYRIGTSLLSLVPDADVPPIGGMFSAGFRYLTVQVWDVRAAHAHLLAAGWTEGRAPVKLGETAFISFVRDPGGSWIEVSQRASLTGPLPD
jgi:lactoylglutathione lyase